MYWLRQLAVSAIAVVIVACSSPASEADPSSNRSQAQGKSASDAPAQPSKDPGLPKAEDILAKALEAHGGRAAFDGIHSYFFSATLTIKDRNIRGVSKFWWKDGDFYNEVDMVGIGLTRAGRRGDEVWTDDPINGLRRLRGVEAEQHTWAGSMSLAADWKKFFEQAETVAKRDEDGRTVFDVKLTSASGTTMTVFFDAENGRQVGRAVSQEGPLGKFEIRELVSDFRELQGILVPFKQISTGVVGTAEQVLDKVEFNVDVDPATFGMPTDGAEVVRAEDLKKPKLPSAPGGETPAPSK